MTHETTRLEVVLAGPADTLDAALPFAAGTVGAVVPQAAEDHCRPEPGWAAA